MSFIKDKKAQGAVEYLLIIGGAILIAAVVIAILATSGGDAKSDVEESNKMIDETRQDLNSLVDLDSNN